MKKRDIVILLGLCLLGSIAFAQSSNKKERKNNLVVKEWNLKAGSHTPFLDNVRTFDAQGRKVEEIEYASYGQKKRTVYEYEGNSKQCSRDVEYNDKNKVSVIHKYEYNDDGSKKKQYNYAPNGKLVATKDFEYTYK
jgi:hypothetical protein